jgi:UDP-N-acetylglucosamine 4,6-dehydratase (inverting)
MKINLNFIKGKTIFLTGGTGSFGNAFVYFVKNLKPKKITIFSRDESKQWDMRNKYKDDGNIEFIIGDIRDKQRLSYSIKQDTDYVVHAAATKIVPTAETNPEECVKTNIEGTINLIQVAKEKKIKKVIALSTDKASNPVNLYGATKLAADKLVISGNHFEQKNLTKFSIIRYGNVLGSRGSVIPFFKEFFTKNKYIPITNKNMTRFVISLKEAVNFVLFGLKDMSGGEIYVKKIPSITILDIAKSVSKNAKIKFIGLRPGEKIHEQMISFEDAPYTYEFKDYYKIIPNINNNKNYYVKGNYKKVKEDFYYSSENNLNWLNSSELSSWIKKNPDYY